MYRWKPNARQKAEYLEKCRQREELPVKTTPYAIRKGCYVKYYSLTKGTIIEGMITNSSYGTTTGQHTFTVDTGKEKICVKGRNLYPNILKHTQGEISLKESK